MRRERAAHPLEGDGDRVRVFGVVTSGGNPVGGAVVQLHDSVRAREAPVASARTANDGTFDLGENTLGEWTVVAYASGHEAIAIGPHPGPLRIELRPCRYPLRGHVRDDSGAAVRGAYVRQRRPDRVWAADAGGAYDVCIDPRAPDLELFARGFDSKAISPRPSDREIDVVLAKLATITGRVVRADTGTPLGGLHVSVWSPMPTAADGSFRYEDLRPGKYHISGGNDEWFIECVHVELRRGETATVTLRARPLFVVHGVVLDEDIPVALSQVCFSEHCFLTDDDGQFKAFAMERGEQTVRVWDRTSVTPSRVMFEPRAPRLVLQVGPTIPKPLPPPPPPPRGRVTRLGSSVAGAEIRDSMGDVRERSRDDGTFMEDHGPDVGAFSRELLAATRKGRVGADGLLILELDEAAAIGGVVVDERGVPLAEVAVRVHSAAERFAAVAYTRRDGSFYIGALPAATYEAQVFRGDTRQLRHQPIPPITVPANDSIVTGVRLAVDTRSASIAGRVVDRDGAPLAGAFVFDRAPVQAIACDSWEVETLPRTGPDGRFRFPNYPLGSSATLTALTCGGGRAELHDVPAGTEDAVLTLETP